MNYGDVLEVIGTPPENAHLLGRRCLFITEVAPNGCYAKTINDDVLRYFYYSELRLLTALDLMAEI